MFEKHIIKRLKIEKLLEKFIENRVEAVFDIMNEYLYLCQFHLISIFF